MFNTEPTEKTGLTKAIDDLLSELDNLDGASPEYAAAADQLVKLHALKVNETRPRVSPDALASIAANLGGVLIIVAYEQKNIIASKALGFIRKLG